MISQVTGKQAAEENAAKIKKCSLEFEEKEIASKYKKLKDDDVQSLQSQIELLEIIKSRQKSGDINQ